MWDQYKILVNMGIPSCNKVLTLSTSWQRGKTPLMHAVEQPNVDVVEVLVNSTADLKITSKVMPNSK